MAFLDWLYGEPEELYKVEPRKRFAKTKRADSVEQVNAISDAAEMPPPMYRRNAASAELAKLPDDDTPEEILRRLDSADKDPVVMYGLSQVDPSRTVVLHSRAMTNIGGTYNPTGTWVYSNPRYPVSLPHEATHAAIRGLKPKLNSDERDFFDARMTKRTSADEGLVRMKMDDLYYGEELDYGSASANQVLDARQNENWRRRLSGPTARDVIERLNALAAEQMRLEGLLGPATETETQ